MAANRADVLPAASRGNDAALAVADWQSAAVADRFRSHEKNRPSTPPCLASAACRSHGRRARGLDGCAGRRRGHRLAQEPGRRHQDRGDAAGCRRRRPRCSRYRAETRLDDLLAQSRRKRHPTAARHQREPQHQLGKSRLSAAGRARRRGRHGDRLRRAGGTATDDTAGAAGPGQPARRQAVPGRLQGHLHPGQRRTSR